jgi:hypothetical protein
MHNFTSFLFLLCLTALSFGCNSTSTQEKEVVQASLATSTPAQDLLPSSFANTSTGLDKYWYQGKGELNVYELEQNRYQGMHTGQALLIFVTEDFLLDKQVKNDRYQEPVSNSASILKMNGITRFTTGIYDYSIMTSVFTPVDTKQQPRTLKVTQSAQDWCGQVYTQVNTREGNYEQQLHSYFETEADEKRVVNANLLEEELMNRIRMDYRSLPVGDDLAVIPSLTFLRLRHQTFQTYAATARLEDYTGDQFTGDALKVYTLEYPNLNRTLAIVFSSVSPYYIEGWTDTYPSAFDGVKRSTRAIRKNTLLDNYWTKNANSEMNAQLRSDLGWEK